jgi:peptide deformylase
MLESRMVVENIIQIGNPILRNKSKKVGDIRSIETKRVIGNLVDSMRHYNLVGMSAGQIGEKLRIFVTEVRKTPSRNPKNIDKLRVFINPKIIWFSKKEVIIYEGCGSVANGNLFGPVKRPEKIKIRAVDENGKIFKLKTNGLLARVIQHEYDHLNGIEFIEKITDMKKVMSRSEYLKMVEKSK